MIVSEHGVASGEAAVIHAEAGMVDAEAGLVDAEAGLVDAEAGMVDAEAGMVDAEAGIVDAEADMVDVEASMASLVTVEFRSGSGGCARPSDRESRRSRPLLSKYAHRVSRSSRTMTALSDCEEFRNRFSQ